MSKKRNLSVRYVKVESGEGYDLREEAINPDKLNGSLFNRIIHGDALEVLPRYPVGCVDLIFTSPPTLTAVVRLTAEFTLTITLNGFCPLLTSIFGF